MKIHRLRERSKQEFFLKDEQREGERKRWEARNGISSDCWWAHIRLDTMRNGDIKKALRIINIAEGEIANFRTEMKRLCERNSKVSLSWKAVTTAVQKLKMRYSFWLCGVQAKV